MNLRFEERTIVVADTIDLVERLAEFYETPEEIVKWLRSPHPQLEGKTAESLIAEGRAVEVEEVLRRLESGGYL